MIETTLPHPNRATEDQVFPHDTPTGSHLFGQPPNQWRGQPGATAPNRGRCSDHAVGHPETSTSQRTVDDWTQALCKGREREFSPAETDITGPKAVGWRNRSSRLIQTCNTCPVLALCRQERIHLESTVGAPLGVMAGMINANHRGASHRRPSAPVTR